jgi:VCBS repeat-containing protein
MSSVCLRRDSRRFLVVLVTLVVVALGALAALPAPSVAAGVVDCGAPSTHQITGTNGSLTLTGPGNWCVHDATFNGGLTIGGGANVHIVNTTIGGRLVADQGGALEVCGSHMGSSNKITNATGFVVLGDPSEGCAGNTFAGAVTVSGGTGGVEIAGSTFSGPLTVDGNTGNGADHGGAADDLGTQIEGNSFSGAVECSSNGSPPTDSGVRNRGSTSFLGQCSAGGGVGVVDEHAANDAYTTLQNTTLSVAAPGVLANDTDAAHSPLHATLASRPAHGTVTLNADGSFAYVPTTGYHGPDSFTYTANDGLSASNAATVTIRVDAPPVAAGDAYTVVRNTTLTIAAPGVLGNDTDPDGDALHAVLVTGPAHGMLMLNGDGSFSYAPLTGFTGADSFTYKANDGFADSNVATVSIVVDTPPVAVNDAFTVAQNGTLSVPALGVLANDTDADGNALHAVLGATTTHGALTLNADGSFAYTPAAGFHGTDSFMYKANDGLADSNVATVSIRVDVPPVAAGDAYTVLENGTLSQAAPGVLSNDSDADGDALTAVLVTMPAHGAVALSPNGSFSYTPASGFHGADSFTYKANDGFADSNGATVSIRVDAPPVARDDAYAVIENATLTVPAAGLLANDTDADGDPLTAAVVADPAHGMLTLNPNGSFTYAPTTGFFGSDRFTYTANDGFADSNVATVTITVNGPPVVVDHSYDAVEGTALSVPAASGVLVGASDPGGHPLTASRVANAAHGSVTVNADGSFLYTPTAGYFGPDSFTFKANDGTLDSNVGTVSIRVDGPPVAAGDAYTVVAGGTLNVAAPGVLANDSDPDGDALHAVLVATTTHGTLALNPDGSFAYTPAAGFHGTDSFMYKANDNVADSNVATVSIRVDAPPVAAADAYSVAQNGTLTVGAATGVLHNDTDTDGDALTASVVSDVGHGSLTLLGDGSFTYVPAGGFIGSDSFMYKGNDGFADSNVATVTITVNGAPGVIDHSYGAVENTPLSIPAASGVLVGASDPGGLPLTASRVANAAHGSVTVNADGSFLYTPTAGYFGPDSFTFKANDGTLDSNVGTVSIRVDGPPVAAGDAYTVVAGGTLNVAAPGVLANDTDPDGDTMHAVLVATTTHGTLTLNPDGSFTYVPTGGFHGSDPFTYKANDGVADSNVVTVSIRVDAPPVAVADAYLVASGQTLTVNAAAGVLANDTDVDSDPLTATLASDVGHGTLTLAGDGSFTYAPAAGFHGTDSFSYKANDGFADSNVAMVTIRVDAPPVATDDSYSVVETHTLTVTAPGVLGNDTDADGDALHAVLVAGPAHGSLTLNPDGSFTYTPTGAFFGSDNFTYKANDGSFDSNVATVTITVTHADQAPVNTVPGAQMVILNHSLAFNAANANAISVADPDALAADVEQVMLSVGHGTVTLAGGSGVSVTGGADGSASVTIAGTLAQLNAALNGLTYAPTAGYTGPETLVVATDDLGHNGTGGPLTTTSNVGITVVAAPPTVVAQSYSGAIANTKFQVGTAAGTGPVVFRTGNALTGDSDPNGGTLSVTAGTITSTNGGTVTMAADGTFVYLPAAGFKGATDTFSYTVNTSEGTSATAQATIHFVLVGQRIWYVDGNAATNGDGRSSSPFNTLAAFVGAGRPDASRDIIFLYKSTAAYAGGITLLPTENLQGQSVGLQFGTDHLVDASGVNPQITNAAGDGIDVADRDAIAGIDVVNASAAGIAGTGNMTNVSINQAVPGSITGSGTTGFSLSGGGGDVLVGSSISGSSKAVSIANRTSGTVTLNGSIAGSGISLTGNTGTTIGFTGALTIGSGAGAGFLATGGGTVSATASGSTLTSTTGKALDVENTTIGSGGLKFQSVSANGGSNGIVLVNTGSSGGLTVTGNGGTCTAAAQSGCSGGQIQNTTGADDSSAAPVGTGIVLDNTLAPSLTRVWLHDASNYAIRGTSVSGFTLANSVISGANGNNGTTPFDDSSVWFDNLTGSASVTSSFVSGGFEDNFRVVNTAGSLNRITFTGDTIGDNSAAGGNDGISLQSASTAGQLEATIQSSTFTGAAGDLLQFDHNGSGAGDLVLTGNAFSNNHPGIATGGGGLTLTNGGTSGPTTMTITGGNTFRDAVGNALTIAKSTGTSTQTGTFSGNTIGVNGVANSGSTEGDGLKLQTLGQGSSTWTVSNNTIHGYNNFGLELEAGGSASAESGAFNATITGNTIDQPGNTAGTLSLPKNGVHLNIGTVPGDTYQACAVIGGTGALANSLASAGKPGDDGMGNLSGGEDVRLRQRQSTTIRLPGYGGAPTSDAAVQAFVAANNPSGGPTVATSIDSPPGGGFTGTGSTCP